MAIRESFLHEIWGHGILWRGKSEQSAKVVSAKNCIFDKEVCSCCLKQGQDFSVQQSHVELEDYHMILSYCRISSTVMSSKYVIEDLSSTVTCV